MINLWHFLSTLQMFLLYITQLISLEHAFSLAKCYFMVSINAFIPRMNAMGTFNVMGTNEKKRKRRRKRKKHI